MTTIIEAFLSAMFSAGIETSETLIADGRLHRFHVLGDGKSSKNGWYILHSDNPPMGEFGCWKRNIRQSWSFWNQPALGLRDQQRTLARRMAIQSESDTGLLTEFYALADATDVWCNARPALNNHGYLVRKGVRSHGLRYHHGALLVPVTDIDNNFHGMQRIWPNGNKSFSKGTILTGHFYRIGELYKNTLLICEGYSTGATLHEATGHAVIIAFSCGNLVSVAEVVRTTWPSSRIVICADDDVCVPGNPGIAAAGLAAAKIDAELVFPRFNCSRNKINSDFNDLYRIDGANAIDECLFGSGGGYDDV